MENRSNVEHKHEGIGLRSPKPYRGYLVYGPRLENTGRWSVSLFHPITKKQFTKTLARYVMEVGLGRKLLKSQHVDHIDGDHMNENIRNLQVLEAKVNISKGSPKQGLSLIQFTCPVCENVSVKRNNHPNDIKRVRFCSKACLYEFGVTSSSFRDKSVVRKALKLNNVSVSTATRNTKHVKAVGERITRRTKGLRRIHEFTRLKGISIL